jgi:hypothetical protein
MSESQRPKVLNQTNFVLLANKENAKVAYTPSKKRHHS